MIASIAESMMIIAVAGCILAFLFVVTSLPAELSSRSLRRFPELAQFATAADASRALRMALRGMLGLRLLAFAGVGIPAFATIAWIERCLW